MPVAGGGALVKTGAWVMMIENAWVASGVVPLVAVIVPVKVPAALGVPEMAPPELSVRPVGNAPAVTVKVLAGYPEAVLVKL